jgi:hypothetical protein
MRGVKRVAPSCIIARTSSTERLGDLSWSKCWIGSGACRCLFVAAVLCWVGWVRYRYVCVRVRGAASTYVLYGRVLSAATRVGRDDPCSLAFARLLLGRENLCCDNFVFFFWLVIVNISAPGTLSIAFLVIVLVRTWKSRRAVLFLVFFVDSLTSRRAS